MTTVLLKVCCIASVAEAELALAHGAHALGLVSAMPSGPGPIPDDDIARIARAVGGRARTFLLTSRTQPAAIAEQVRAAGTDTVQLVDALADGALQELRALLPGVALVQVIHVRDASALDQARAWAPHVDALLLDSGNPNAAIRELGGTGRTHDWSISAELVRAVAPCPVFLAGGLRADNVAEAVRTVRPAGVDVCSGVRTGGSLDGGKLAEFVAGLRLEKKLGSSVIRVGEFGENSGAWSWQQRAGQDLQGERPTATPTAELPITRIPADHFR